MRTLGNLLWFILGGFVLGLGWFVAGVVMAITIVGIPFGVQHLKLASLSLLPVGKTIVTSEEAAAARARNAMVRR